MFWFGILWEECVLEVRFVYIIVLIFNLGKGFWIGLVDS